LEDRVEAAKAALAAALRVNPIFTMAMVDAFYASSNKESTERCRFSDADGGQRDQGLLCQISALGQRPPNVHRNDADQLRQIDRAIFQRKAEAAR
jgi:hypothetical protein